MALIDNLVSYWKMNEASGNAADSFGSNTLTNTGSNTFAAGLFGNAVSIGTSTNKFMGRTDQCGLTATGSYSMSMWVKLASETTTDRELFQLYFSGGSGALYRGLYEYNGGTRRVRFFRIGSGVNFLDVTGNIANNTWRHIVYTYDGTTQKLYVNNAAPVSSSNTGNTDAGAALTNFGGGVTNQAVNGLIDECALWSRTITSAEVSELYNGGAGLELTLGGFTPNPLMHQRMMASGMV